MEQKYSRSELVAALTKIYEDFRDKPEEFESTIAAIIYLMLFVLSLYGWVANLFKLVGMIGGELGTLFIARIAGVVIAPLGIILGYM